jgi:Spy/CpxP family protein refolding chaperone
MRNTTIAVMALALAASATPLATPLAAQARGNASARRGDAVRPASPRDGMTPAAALLRAREQLELTDEQVQRLEALAGTQRAALRRSPSEGLRLRADLMDAMAGDGNPAAARAALDKMSAARNTRLVAGLEARQAAFAILTPAQRTTAEAQRRRLGARVGQRAAADRQGARRGDRGAVRAPRPNAGNQEASVRPRPPRSPDGRPPVEPSVNPSGF